MLKLATEIVGCALVLAGVAAIFPPAALILSGAALVYAVEVRS